MDWVQVTQALGVPIALLVAIGAGFWRTLVWAAPKVEKIIEVHIALVNALKAEHERYAEAREKTLETIDRIDRATFQAVQTMDKTAERIDQIVKDIPKICKACKA